MAWRQCALEGLVMSIQPNFWRHKKVFITGHTGFKGSWLSLWLQSMGATVCGFSLAPDTTPNLFTAAKIAKGMQSILGDIRDRKAISAAIHDFSPEIIFHLAAQPLVRYSYDNPVETYETNVLGTVHVLEAARHLPHLRAFINVTTDKCYENREWIWGYRETDPLGGIDPYSSSKACAEIVTSAYRSSFFEKLHNKAGLASVRAGNVIGGGDWAADRLIPDLVRACMAKQAPKIRYPNAIRPWQHVLEPLSGYLMLAEKLFANTQHFSQAWNFGPEMQDAKPVKWIAQQLLQGWQTTIEWEQDVQPHPHEAQSLKLDCTKAHVELGWQPHWNLAKSLEAIITWYKAYETGSDMQAFSLQQIENHMATSTHFKKDYITC